MDGKAFVLAALMATGGLANAQVAKYETFIHTSSDLPKAIERVKARQDGNATRRFGAEVASSTLDAGKGIASGYVTSFIDMGVNAVASLVTSKARHRSEWLETVQAENSWSTALGNVDEMKDFYRTPSTGGALDPEGMCFDGIGCLRMEGADTVFFISCHIDRSKLSRIVNHSKFELVRDKLADGDMAVEFVSFTLNADSTMYVAYVLRKGWDSPRLVPLFEESQLTQVQPGEQYTTTDVSQLVWQPPEEALRG